MMDQLKNNSNHRKSRTTKGIEFILKLNLKGQSRPVSERN